MAYQSPFRFLNHATTDTDTRSIQRLKRQLLTEFYLNDQQPLVRDGVSLSKDEALTLFDALTPQTWLFHQQIWANKPLLAFLESGELPTTNWQDTLPDTPENQPLYAFLLPAYASRYADALVQAFDAVQPDRLVRVLGLPMIDAGSSTSLYYRRLWSRLIQIVRELEKRIDDLATLPYGAALFQPIKEDFNHYERLTTVLVMLPIYFKPAIYQIASALGELFLQLNAITWRYYWLKRRAIHLMQCLGPEGRQRAKEVSQEQIRRVSERRNFGWYFDGSIRPLVTLADRLPGILFVLFIFAISYSSVKWFEQQSVAPRYNTAQLDSLRAVALDNKLPNAGYSLAGNGIGNQLSPFEPAGSVRVSRPATGSHPLESWLLTRAGYSIDTYNEEAHIEIQNRSSQDVIGCFYSPEDSYAVSYYVRAGDTAVVTFLHGGQADQYGLRWQAGKAFSRQPVPKPSVIPLGFARPVPVVPADGYHKAPYAFRPTTVDEMSRKEPFQLLDSTVVRSLYLTRMLKSDREPYTVFRLTDAGKAVAVAELTVKP